MASRGGGQDFAKSTIFFFVVFLFFGSNSVLGSRSECSSATLVALCVDEDEPTNNRHHHDHNYHHNDYQIQSTTALRHRLLVSSLPSAAVTKCDFGLAPTPSPFTLMSRQETVDYLQRTAQHKSALQQRYDFDNTIDDSDKNMIGVGSFGAVLKATCKSTQQVVAIKRLPKESTSSAAVQRELQALLAIRQAGGHPNLTALREHFVQDDESDAYYYLVMDLVPGGELFDALWQSGPLREADAARFVRQMASACQFLHALGLVHADLKPENCILSERNPSTASIKLVDFGCCQPAARPNNNDDNNCASKNPTESPSRNWFGSGNNKNKKPNVELSSSSYNTDPEDARIAVTPAYCPPEVLAEMRKFQRQGRHDASPTITTAYDMWSLGVILFVMLVGAHPFDLRGQASDEEIAHSILQARLVTSQPEWHKHIQDLSPEVQDLLKRLMHPDPKQRLTADELLASPWVRGLTASSQKLPQSDKRLATYKLHQTKVAAQFFKRMLQHSRTTTDAAARRRTSGLATAQPEETQQKTLLEAAFAQLDTAGRGYISSKELNGDTSWLGADAKLNLPEATELLSQTHMKDHYFPAGHVIYHEGEPGDVMYFIHSGRIKAESQDGYVKDKGAGDFFGEDVLGDNDAYAFTARCITPVHAIQILRKDYNKYIAHDEDLALIMKEHGRIRRRERVQVLLGMEKKTKPINFAQGDMLFQRGDKGDNLYVLLEGDVDISVNGHKVRSLRQGEMTGEHAAYYGHKPYNVTAQCMSDSCTLGVLPGQDLRKALAKNPVLQESFHDIIMRRDFKKALCAHLERPFPETEQEMKEAFQALLPDKNDFNKNEDDSPVGEVDLETLQKLMKSFDPTYTDEDIQSILRSLDLTNSQSLTWSEFKTIFAMQSQE